MLFATGSVLVQLESGIVITTFPKYQKVNHHHLYESRINYASLFQNGHTVKLYLYREISHGGIFTPQKLANASH